MEQNIGTHVTADIGGCEADLGDEELIKEVLLGAARAAGATILSVHTHKFGGAGGVTGVVVLAESHCSLHSYPELGYAAFDAFVCGSANAEAAADYAAKALVGKDVSKNVFKRAVPGLTKASIAA